jgi:TonB family protein
MKTHSIRSLMVAIASALLVLGAPAQGQVDSLPNGLGELMVDPIVQPEFPGGIEKMYVFIRKELRYPEAAKAQRKEGKVYVEFVIEEDGRIVDPKVIRGLDPDMDAEAMRIVRAMPDWIPGSLDGRPLRTRMVLPISFRL